MSLGSIEDMFEFIQWCKAVGLDKRETKDLCIKEGYLKPNEIINDKPVWDNNTLIYP